MVLGQVGKLQEKMLIRQRLSLSAAQKPSKLNQKWSVIWSRDIFLPLKCAGSHFTVLVEVHGKRVINVPIPK